MAWAKSQRIGAIIGTGTIGEAGSRRELVSEQFAGIAAKKPLAGLLCLCLDYGRVGFELGSGAKRNAKRFAGRKYGAVFPQQVKRDAIASVILHASSGPHQALKNIGVR